MDKKSAVLFASFFFIVLPVLCSAETPTYNQITTENIEDIINNVLNFIWIIFFGFSIVMFIVSGFLFLTSRGDPGKLKIARDSLIWGAVGVVVAILAFSITSIINNVLTPTPPPPPPPSP